MDIYIYIYFFFDRVVDNFSITHIQHILKHSFYDTPKKIKNKNQTIMSFRLIMRKKILEKKKKRKKLIKFLKEHVMDI